MFAKCGEVESVRFRCLVCDAYSIIFSELIIVDYVQSFMLFALFCGQETEVKINYNENRITIFIFSPYFV